MRYIIDYDIKKKGEEWEYPYHQQLQKETKLLPIEKYLERRREILRKYLETNRRNLIRQAEKIRQHKYNPKKVLW